MQRYTLYHGDHYEQTVEQLYALHPPQTTPILICGSSPLTNDNPDDVSQQMLKRAFARFHEIDENFNGGLQNQALIAPLAFSVEHHRFLLEFNEERGVWKCVYSSSSPVVLLRDCVQTWWSQKISDPARLIPIRPALHRPVYHFVRMTDWPQLELNIYTQLPLVDYYPALLVWVSQLHENDNRLASEASYRSTKKTFTIAFTDGTTNVQCNFDHGKSQSLNNFFRKWYDKSQEELGQVSVPVLCYPLPTDRLLEVVPHLDLQPHLIHFEDDDDDHDEEVEEDDDLGEITIQELPEADFL